MYEHEHEQQQELTKKQSLLGWMKIHGVDSRALIQVDSDNSRTLDDSDGMRVWRGPNLLDKMLVKMW